MKGFVWATAALGATAVVALLALRQRQGLVLVSPRPQLVETARARCPDYTLEDNGVCLPVTRQRVPASGLVATTWLNPDVIISAFDVYWRDAPIAPVYRPHLSGDAPVLLVRTHVGASVICPRSLTEARVTHVQQTTDGVWLATITGASANGETQPFTVTGLTSIEATISVGALCPAGTPLGNAGDALVIYVAREGHELAPTAPPPTLVPSAPAPSSTGGP